LQEFEDHEGLRYEDIENEKNKSKGRNWLKKLAEETKARAVDQITTESRAEGQAIERRSFPRRVVAPIRAEGTKVMIIKEVKTA